MNPISQFKIEDLKETLQEIERLNKSGPIAIADYLIENNGSLEDLHQKIDSLLSRIKLIPQQ